MKQNGVVNIRRKIIHNGLEIDVDRKTYFITYPTHIWQIFPEVYRQTFADTMTFFFTNHLSMINSHKLVYNFPPPATEPFFYMGMINSLPETVMVEGNGLTMSKLLLKFYNSQYNIEFTGRPRYARFKNVNRNRWSRSIVPFSFGKDSLLTFAFA